MTLGATSFVVEGELTIYRAAEFRVEFKRLLTAGGDFEVDLSGVTEIDSSGVQLLLAVTKTAAAQECVLRLVKHSAAVKEVLDILGLGQDLGERPLPAPA